MKEIWNLAKAIYLDAKEAKGKIYTTRDIAATSIKVVKGMKVISNHRIFARKP